MAITDRVQEAFYDAESDSDDAQLIRLAPNGPPSKGPTRRHGRWWTHEEHDRFLQAMELYPSGPWKDIADHVGTRSTRQTMTHAQKYRQKIARWRRGATIKPMTARSADVGVRSNTAASSSVSLGASSPTCPASPQCPEEVDTGMQHVVAATTAAIDDEASEEDAFWQVLEDILEESDHSKFEESLVALLDESSAMDFTVLETPQTWDVDAIFENFSALV